MSLAHGTGPRRMGGTRTVPRPALLRRAARREFAGNCRKAGTVFPGTAGCNLLRGMPGIDRRVDPHRVAPEVRLETRRGFAGSRANSVMHLRKARSSSKRELPDCRQVGPRHIQCLRIRQLAGRKIGFQVFVHQWLDQLFFPLTGVAGVDIRASPRRSRLGHGKRDLPRQGNPSLLHSVCPAS